MENSLLMKTEASSALNFLVYIQNIFLNQNRSEEEYRFPYIPSKYIVKEEFELRFKELWDEVIQRVSEHPKNDMKIFYEEKDLFHQRLFVDGNDSLKEYSEIHQTFKVWWDSFAGRFSVERAIDEKGQKLYEELANFLTQREIAPQKELNIGLVYDEFPLGNFEVSSYFAVVSIKEVFVKYKELMAKLQKSIY
ncbi:hypothetical protein [Lentibacillus sp. CBA3610]|uniref:hypothetical protein n=1 Tax=Lentibacillus sp. CBA3610 TaxID=2518176 RepID=UPI001595DE9E|nr:hypothetical protein [Lentibacillus sp. CBA3610]QKY68552.1 hypothetical protein Len3610_02020 [Lentibacillus sp. CBA3610]